MNLKGLGTFFFFYPRLNKGHVISNVIIHFNFIKGTCWEIVYFLYESKLPKLDWSFYIGHHSLSNELREWTGFGSLDLYMKCALF